MAGAFHTMFNKLFNRKKEPADDPLNITVRDLHLGYILEYDLRTWEITAEYEYDWGDENFSKEYRLSDGKETRYLSVEENDQLELTWSRKIKLAQIQSDLARTIENDGRPPDTLVFEGRTYYFDEESPGYFNDLGEKNEAWEEFIVWDYYDEEDQYCLSIERWDERSFDASVGKVLAGHEISNILPRER